MNKQFPILAFTVVILLTALIAGIQYIPFGAGGFILGYYLRDIFDLFKRK